MKKGFEWSIQVFATIVLGVISAGIFYAALSGSTPPANASNENITMDTSCNNDNDCTNNLDGSKCMVIYPGEFESFCGCLTSADCVDRRNEICDSNNKCI